MKDCNRRETAVKLKPDLRDAQLAIEAVRTEVTQQREKG
jgi:hypothetical protein